VIFIVWCALCIMWRDCFYCVWRHRLFSSVGFVSPVSVRPEYWKCQGTKCLLLLWCLHQVATHQWCYFAYSGWLLCGCVNMFWYVILLNYFIWTVSALTHLCMEVLCCMWMHRWGGRRYWSSAEWVRAEGD